MLTWLACGSVFASAPAGFVIQNRAEATYIPAGRSLPETLYSNTVDVRVAAVEALTLAQDQTATKAEGTVAVLPHVLTNTGNLSSRYAFSLQNLAGDQFDLADLRLVLDTDRNGVVGPQDQVLPTGSGALTLQPGETAMLLVVGTVPAGAGNSSALVRLTATTTGADPLSASVTDTINTGRRAALQVFKSVSPAGSAIPGATLRWNVVVTNTGDSPAAMAAVAGPTGTPVFIDGNPATVFLIRDTVPVGTAYAPGSITTSIPGAIRLYRLPGDLPYRYRTNGDDAAAVEVAVASTTFRLQPNATTDLTFSSRIKSDTTATVVNTAAVVAHDGTAPVESLSNPVLVPLPVDRIGIAKRASLPVYEFDPTTRLPRGTAVVPFKLVVQSFSGVPLQDVQVEDILQGAERFGTYTGAEYPAQGQYTIVPGSLTVAPRPGSTAAVNAEFTGTATRASLLAPGAVLAPAGVIEIAFSLRLNVVGADRLIDNTASAKGTRSGGITLSDASVDGSEPDANKDGDPTNDASPTRVLVSLPDIQLRKSVGKPRQVESSTWDVDFTLEITNAGRTTASYVRVIDNLECAFQTWKRPKPVTSWQLVGPPKAVKGLLRVNTAYTGSAECTAAQQTNTNAFLALPDDLQLSLTDGQRHLEPGQAETITFTVRFLLNPLVKMTERIFTNVAYTAIADRPGREGMRVLAASQANTLVQVIDPSGVVYQSTTRAPVAGAVVQLVRLSCDAAALRPITSDDLLPVEGTQYTFLADGSASMKTVEDGRYFFFLRSPPVMEICDYGLVVQPPPASDLVWPSTAIPAQKGSALGGPVQPQLGPPQPGAATPYYLIARSGPNVPDVTNNHIPVDPRPVAGTLLLEKKSDRQLVEVGNSLVYTLNMRNTSGVPLQGVSFTDRLPVGFRYQPGTTRLGDAAVADPQRQPGNVLQFAFPQLRVELDQVVTLTYRVQAGMTALPGDAINRAQGFSGPFVSNLAERRVRVDGGVFSDDAYLVGKVYLDCKRDGMQEKGEPGVPGVRLLLEDGTSVVTDVEGKYSLYGLRAITHVLKVDGSTLPRGALLGIVGPRDGGRPDSRFVDLKKGELHRADFVVENCADAGVVEEVQARRKALAERPDGEGIAVSRARLALDAQPSLPLDQARRRQSAGELTPTGPANSSTAAAAAARPAPVFTPVETKKLEADAARPLLAPSVPPRVDLEQLVQGADSTLAFIDLRDGDTLPMAQVNVRLKGRLGTILQLSVNGRLIGQNRVGKRVKVPDAGVEAWEYIGVDLVPGSNELLVEAIDEFGIARGRATLRVAAPGAAGRIEVEAPRAGTADGKTPLPVRVRLLDDKGLPVTARTQLTLEVDNGRWEPRDLNPGEPGVQVFLEGGVAEFLLLPPATPGDATVRVSAGSIRQERSVAWLPELRPLIGSGILEGVLDFRNKGVMALGRAPGNPFEESLRSFSRESADGSSTLAGRAAFYFKGAVKGEYLLTVAYDSDKSTRERLFRDIQPDRFYPVYGDSSSKQFDAQSTGRMYLRIDKERSWLLLGDFTTGDSGDSDRRLSSYDRAATGVKSHFENETIRGNVYARRGAMTQVIVELQANGTSGPYQIPGSGTLVENSERIEILTRDRRQPSVVLQSQVITRFTDYLVEPLTRTVRFSSPVASLDENLNPRSIRITYEAETGGLSYWMYGADAQLKLSGSLQVGASVARDQNPANVVTIAGVTAVLKPALDPQSVIKAELAASETDLSGRGYAGRVEWTKDSESLRVRAQGTATDSNFDNPGSGFGKGRVEATVDATYKVSKDVAVRTEGIYSRDSIAGTERAGLLATVSVPVTENVRADAGLRLSHSMVSPDVATPAPSPLPGAGAGVGAGVGAPLGDLVTLRLRLSAQLPQFGNGRVYVEAEQDVRDSDRRLFAVGADYQLTEQAKVYARYEFISSLGNPYALSSSVQNNVAVIGLETSYLANGRTFNEFRLRDTINGREMQAATGVRRTWQATEGVRLGGSFENTKAFGGVPGNAATAVTGSVEYTGNPRLRLFGNLELRMANGGDSQLLTLGAAWKVDAAWSLLARSANSVQQSRASGTRTLISRQQLGFAWREVETNEWSVLGRYEYNVKDVVGSADARVDRSHIVSLHANYQPWRGTVLSGRYAFKRVNEEYMGVGNSFSGTLLYGRWTQDIGKRFDVSLQASALLGRGDDQRYALGLEAGVQALDNLWLSLGYNFTGYARDAITAGEYLLRGYYARMRFKFDEGAFK